VTKQYEKDLTAEQRRQFEAYKKELMDQIRSRKDLFDQQRVKEREEARQQTGLALGEYNPDFRDLLRQELERQIRENRERRQQDRQTAAAQDKERLRRQSEVLGKAEAEAADQQASTRKKLKELVKGDFDSAWNRRQQARRVKAVEQEPQAEPLAVNRRAADEEDYMFVKTLTENERKIVEAEQANRLRVQAALRQSAQEALDGRPKVIVADKLFDKC
jgi:hypothetical protein